MEEHPMNSFHRWFCRTSVWKKALANEIIPWALKDVELGGDVLEVGPGPGMTTDILRERLPRMTSIEVVVIINGSFGSGKTTVANFLCKSIPGSVIYDPEWAGFVPRRLPGRIKLEGAGIDDYQNIRL
jgi:hypothetical protein